MDNAIALNRTVAEFSGRQITLKAGMPRGAITGIVNANLAIASSSNRDLPTNRADCAAGGILIFVADVELNDIKAMACSNRFRVLSFVFTELMKLVRCHGRLHREVRGILV
jgi:hypothetical protein